MKINEINVLMAIIISEFLGIIIVIVEHMREAPLKNAPAP